MAVIEDLFIQEANGTLGNPIDWDPLQEPNALQEVGLLDCRVCPLTGRAGLLLDMRTALQYRTGNAALLTISGLRSFQWREVPPALELMSFTIMSSTPLASNGVCRMDIGLHPDGQLSISGGQAGFYLLEASGLPEGLPDYTDRSLGEVRRYLPWWNSECVVLESSTRQQQV